VSDHCVTPPQRPAETPNPIRQSDYRICRMMHQMQFCSFSTPWPSSGGERGAECCVVPLVAPVGGNAGSHYAGEEACGGPGSSRRGTRSGPTINPAKRSHSRTAPGARRAAPRCRRRGRSAAAGCSSLPDPSGCAQWKSGHGAGQRPSTAARIPLRDASRPLSSATAAAPTHRHGEASFRSAAASPALGGSGSLRENAGGSAIATGFTPR